MKSIIVLLVAAMALVGFASAWTSQNCLEYQYTKVVKTQAGEHLDWFDGVEGQSNIATQSSASFTSEGEYGTESASILNRLDDVDANLIELPGCALTATPTTKDTLTQGGYAIVFTEAPDLQEPCNLKKFGVANAWEEIDLSGNYAGQSGAATADLYNEVNVGIDGIAVQANTVNMQTEVDTGNNDGDRVVDAIMGSSITAGFKEINAYGAVPTMFGNVDAWAGFEGAYEAGNDNYVGIHTYVDGEGYFKMWT
jgi:hypothetical protein